MIADANGRLRYDCGRSHGIRGPSTGAHIAPKG